MKRKSNKFEKPGKIELRILFLVTCFLFTSKLFAADEWLLIKSENEIQIYLKQQKNSPLKESKGVVKVKVPLHNLVQLLLDNNSATKWMHNMAQYKVVKQLSDTEKFTYTVVDFPWPTHDRDCLVHSRIWQDSSNGKGTIALSGQTEYNQENSSYVRMKKFQGSWQFTLLENGYVEVVYQVSTDPGGDIPPWMVNLQIIEIPCYTLRNLKRMVKDEKYNVRPDWLKK